MASKKKAQWRLRWDGVHIEPEDDRRGKWTVGLEVEIKEIDFGLNRTYYHLTFRWNGNDGWCGDMFVVKVRRESIPENLIRGEWASNRQARSLLRQILPKASRSVREQYEEIVNNNPWAKI